MGPSKDMYRQRLAKSYDRELTSFMRDYNHKLVNGLTALSLVSILIARFIVKSGLMELCSWVSFAVLEVSPKLSVLDADITKREWWHYVVATYEHVVYNRFIDIDGDGMYFIVLLLLWALYLRFRRRVVLKEKSDD